MFTATYSLNTPFSDKEILEAAYYEHTQGRLVSIRGIMFYLADRRADLSYHKLAGVSGVRQVIISVLKRNGWTTSRRGLSRSATCYYTPPEVIAE